MTKLTTKKRDALPKKDFGLPGEKKYPMPDKNHAKNAKSRASAEVNKGKMSKSTESKIDAKANKILGETKMKKETKKHEMKESKAHEKKESKKEERMEHKKPMKKGK